jgi:hypothetical protein
MVSILLWNHFSFEILGKLPVILFSKNPVKNAESHIFLRRNTEAHYCSVI